MNTTATRVEDVAETVQNTLGAQLQARRSQLSISQSELADRAGISRNSVVRAEQGNLGTSLNNVARMALALGLTPRLLDKSAPGDLDQYTPAADDIVHRGACFNRTQHGLDGRDRQREKALAQAWLDANKPGNGAGPLLQALVPGHSQEAATAVATVFQFLGSVEGFRFLSGAMEKAGCELADPKSQT